MMRKSSLITYCAILLITGLPFWGCSPKTLAIFFDGVPNPDDSVSLFNDQKEYLKKQSGMDKETVIVEKQKYYFHVPYQEKECASCHDQNVMGKFVEAMPSLCYQCHDDFSTLFPNLHAPVEAGECISCHNPHMSENKHLLKLTGQKLCFECHDQEDVLKTENHSDIGDANCTECHNPHGSKESFLLN
jgi:predicted CXXCH cytochrome family protein